MDVVSIAAALEGIKSATDIAKLLKNSSDTLEQAEVRLQLAELIGALADIKIELANTKEYISQKKKLLVS